MDHLGELESGLMLVIANQLGLFFQNLAEFHIASDLCPCYIQFRLKNRFGRKLDAFIVENSNRHLLDEREVYESELSGYCASHRAKMPQLLLKFGDLLEL